MNELDLDALIAFADDLADASGAVIRRYFRTGIAVGTKGDGSPVTRADRETEDALRSRIERRFPEHGIFGEEHGRARETARYQWVLDPIDGTKAFIVGVPLFGTLIALCDQGRPVLGVIDQPILKERWIGASGRPTTMNGNAVRSRRGVPLGEAVMCSTAPDMFLDRKAEPYARLAARAAFVRWGVDCYASGLLALGLVDLQVEACLKPYDFCALVPVIAGAGGVISDWGGAPLAIDSGETMLAAATPELHRTALELLSG